jgi:hypothetical protein
MVKYKNKLYLILMLPWKLTTPENSYIFVGSWFLVGEWVGSLYMTDTRSLIKQG